MCVPAPLTLSALGVAALFVMSCGGDEAHKTDDGPLAEDAVLGEIRSAGDVVQAGMDTFQAPHTDAFDALGTPEGDVTPGPDDGEADHEGEAGHDASEADAAEVDGEGVEVTPPAEYDGPYGPYMIGLELDEATQALFETNAARFEEIVLSHIGHLKNPLWSIHQLGYWAIYFHIEEWSGPVGAEAIAALTETYQSIANDWVKDLHVFDSEAPDSVEVRVFGFVIQEGIEIAPSFWESYGDYPVVTGYTRTNEEAPWHVVERTSGETFDQNWYQKVDFLELRVQGNRDDLAETVTFHPEDWADYVHPESVDMFYTKFWHRVSWDAVAQRQYLKIGGQISDYQSGTANEAVFAHEMGHCFFLDDVYDPGKYPEGQSLISLMNMSQSIEDFDRMTLRMVWERQRETSSD